MEGRADELKAKLDRLLKEAAEAAVALDRADGTIQGVPHYSIIEARAHDLGRQFSRQIQQRQMGEVAALATPTGKCPHCGTRSELAPDRRTVTSIDGPLEVQEMQGYCSVCRRAFFPSAGNIGL